MSNEVRKVYLDNLPKRGITNQIDWKNSVGYKIKFIYEDIEGEIEIVGYSLKINGYLTIKYKEKIWDKDIHTRDMQKCGLGVLLGKITDEFKVSIKDNIKDNSRDMIITNSKTEVKYIGSRKYNKKYYQYKCNKCGFDCGEHYKNGETRKEYWIEEGNLLDNKGCACCCQAPRLVVPKINSIWATDPWMIDLGISEEDAKKYLSQSNKKITVKCPDCSKVKNIKVSDIYNRKSICCSCGDGKSYPEKFVMGFLNQLNIEYEIEFSPVWTDRRFDFHIKSNNSIVETHGKQHPGTKYHDVVGFSSCGKKARTPQQELENDIYKEKLAKENGIENYIVIDCSKSDMEFIKNEILNSKLAKLYNLSNINWLECEKFALSNRVKEVCDYWNQKEEWETTKSLADRFKIERNTVIRYLKNGTNLDWCYYCSKEEMIKNSSRNGKSTGKPIEIFKDDVSLGVFESAPKLASESEKLFGVKFNSSKIGDVCRGSRPHHYGYTFKYI